MSDSPHIPVLAIDGGGTRCRVALRDGGDVIAVEAGSANVSTDFDGSLAQIMEGLLALSAKSGHGMDALARFPAFVGLAGVVGGQIADRMRDRLPFAHLRIADDRPAALRGALDRREGVLAHCGTGSFFGAQIAGQMRFAGGWGPILGDEASAQWIGRVALRGTLETVDGFCGMTGLAQALLDRFGDAAGVVRFGASARPSDFGALAPLVTARAASGDALGKRIMAAGAAEIARNLPLIGWTRGKTICLTGGIGPHFRPYLPGAMQADVAKPAGNPLAGALALASELAGEVAQ